MNIEDFDKMFSKYVLVWIWSILFGTSTGLTYSLIEYRPERWGQLALPLLVLSVIGIVSVFAALMALINFLLNYLIPLLFLKHDAPDKLEMKPAAIALRRACLLLVFAALARAGMALTEIAFSYVSRP